MPNWNVRSSPITVRTGEMLTILKANTHLAEQYCTGGIKTDAGKARQIIFPDKIMPLVREAYRSGTKRLCEVDEKTFYAEWHDMAQRVGLQPDMTPYCLRHTTATLLAVEKVAPAIIKEVLGTQTMRSRWATPTSRWKKSWTP